MENLFGLLYLADISCNMSIVLRVLGVLGLAALGIAIVIMGVIHLDENVGEAVGALVKRLRFYIVFFPVLILLSCLLPSRETVYIYLGVKTTTTLADTVASSSLGQKTLKLLEQRVDAALKENITPTKCEEK